MMRYKLRHGADHGQWISLLLPFCFIPLTFKSYLVEETLILAVLTWLCVSQFIEQRIYSNESSVFNTCYVFHLILSIPASFVISWILSYDIISLFIICLSAVMSYNYLISKLLINCRGSFTLGEVQVIAQGILLFVFCSLNSFKQHNDYYSVGTNHNEAMDLLRLLLLALLLLVCSLYLLPSLRKGIKFHCMCFSFVAVVILVWSISHQKNVFIWFLDYCLYKRKRVYLLLFWTISTLASIIFVVWINQRAGYTASSLDRKYFHIVINAVYIPGVVYDVQFLCFASGIALGAFILLEIYRILDVIVIGPAIEQAFHIFLDEKDSGLLILTHIYLLIGCSCPIWLSYDYVNKSEYHMSLLSGIISVGFGDTFAAVGGRLFGKNFWKGSKKTLEGTACAVIAQLVCSFYFIYIGHHFSLFNISLVTIVILLTSLLEAKTNQVDNLILPLFMFSFLSWIN